MAENIHFENLMPTNDYKLGIYENAMNFVFSDKHISNIAITGPYASGKSSMIKTYEEHSNKNFVYISLAHFDEVGKNKEDKYQIESSKKEGREETKDEGENVAKKELESNINNTLEEENRLEGKIINQLIHKIDPKKIPQTNFKIKKKIEDKEMKIRTAVLSVFIILTLYILFFKFWHITVSNMNIPILKFLLEITLNTEVLIVAGVICVTITIGRIYKSIENQHFMKSLRKLNIQGNEIEIFEDNNESYFDKYLNEILYIIKNSGVDAIIFEDIDRYNSGLIFEKLREINNLVNSEYNEKEQVNNKIIKFIYLLKDDMFTSKDRTKFFDYIIPIIPVIDSSNSYDKFIEQFKKGNLFELIDEDFFKDISLYVDDMRLLKNIYNEFCIYYNRLEKDILNESKNEKVELNLNNNKLLGMIVYKNIFPKDFSDLQLGQGFVYCVLHSKEKIIKEEIEKIDNKINLLKEEIENIKAEQLNNIDELDACFFTYNNKIMINNKTENQFENRVEFIKALKNNQYNCEEYTRGYWDENNLKSVFERITSNDEYKKRKELIENKSKNKIEVINKRINELNYNLFN